MGLRKERGQWLVAHEHHESARVMVADLQVALSKQRDVVTDIAGDDVGERAPAEWIVAGDAAAIPQLGRQLREERQWEYRRRPAG